MENADLVGRSISGRFKKLCRLLFFCKKLPGSKVLAIEGEDGKLLTMAHLNPYIISVNGKKMGN